MAVFEIIVLPGVDVWAIAPKDARQISANAPAKERQRPVFDFLIFFVIDFLDTGDRDWLPPTGVAAGGSASRMKLRQKLETI